MKLFKECLKLYHKYEEIINYLITGFIGVVVNVASFYVCRQISLSILVSNVISWIVAVILMYILNKLFVFKSKKENNKQLFQEFCSFVFARIITLIIETLILYLGVLLITKNDIVIKIIAQIVTIILNYIFSKFIIFKKKEK